MLRIMSDFMNPIKSNRNHDFRYVKDSTIDSYLKDDMIIDIKSN